MKKILFALFLAGILFGCSENNINTDLIGKWKLTEILADPGDGSGTFHAVSSDKILEFHADGTVTSNGPICYMTDESDSPGSGTYSLADSTITSPDCQDFSIDIRFKQTGSTLILYYPCIEPCAAKYKKE